MTAFVLGGGTASPYSISQPRLDDFSVIFGGGSAPPDFPPMTNEGLHLGRQGRNNAERRLDTGRLAFKLLDQGESPSKALQMAQNSL
jgi:hypothetical protein